MRRSKSSPNSVFLSIRESLIVALSFALATFFIAALTAQAQTPAPQLSADLSHSPGWVVISVDDYQHLRARAFPTERDPEPPPVDAVAEIFFWPRRPYIA